MTNNELLKRIAVAYSPLSGTIQIGFLDKKRYAFLEKKDETENAMVAVFTLLKSQGCQWEFTEKESGKTFALRVIEVAKPVA